MEIICIILAVALVLSICAIFILIMRKKDNSIDTNLTDTKIELIKSNEKLQDIDSLAQNSNNAINSINIECLNVKNKLENIKEKLQNSINLTNSEKTVINSELKNLNNNDNNLLLNINNNKNILENLNFAQEKLASEIKLSINENLSISKQTAIKLEQKNIRDNRVLSSIENIENVLIGTNSKGQSGENIIENIIKVLPKQWIVRDLKISGKPVQFAIKIGNKYLPIDSKMSSTGLIQEYNKQTDSTEKEKIKTQIENNVYKKAQEVTKYIDLSSNTFDFGIAVIPNSIYDLCEKTVSQSYRDFKVMVLPYSMLLSYILLIVQYQNKNNKEINVEKLQAYIKSSQQSLKNLAEEADSRLSKAIKMAENSRDQLKQQISKLSSGLNGILKNK